MKVTDKITAKSKVAVPKQPHESRPPNAKVVMLSEWAPQPSTLTREEIRKIVIDQIG
ncbi:hypothetical protein [Microvirga solisilvae]|uniref:hypothetical protein n=1 Tax=Microvirga solisilvae TaxID=2919498 RepID=UPI001FAE7C3E|nr:hypothetical protein [Microvirga solisilvae]